MAFEFKLPDIGEGVVEGEIVEWLVQVGDMLEEDQPMVEVITDKATVELPSPKRGRVLSRTGKAGDIVEVGSVLIVIDEDESAPSSDTPTPSPASDAVPPAATPLSPPPPVQSPVDKRRSKALATPAVRRLAREMGVDLSQVSGSGPGGRVLREDLSPTAQAPSVTAPLPVDSDSPAQVIPYRALRRKIGDRMALSKRTAPHFTYVDEVDMTELVTLRDRYKQTSDGQKAPITYLPFLVQAVVRGLKKFPIVNSSLDEEAGEIRLHSRRNIGIAVDTENGLIVPVVKDADRKSLQELAAEITRLSQDARRGKVSLDDLRQGTFTITSLGKLGGVMATPILNYPEVAILGVHKISEKPVVRQGQIVVRRMMNLSVSMDHRVVDGATGAAFLNSIIPYLESPALLLL